MQQLPIAVEGGQTPLATTPADLSPPDLAALNQAVTLLEQTSFAMRLTSLFGHQLEFFGRMVPERFSALVSRGATLALKSALATAFKTLRSGSASPSRAPSPLLHRALAVASGAAGGAFGINSLAVELPISTTLILRSIADIARSEGEDLAAPETALACLQVFALGGRGPGDETSIDGGYFAVRGMLAKTLGEAVRYVVQRGAAEESAPVIMRLISMISSRFGALVTQKAMAQAIPVLGAASGAAINYAFMQHFQDVARGHFIVRRLERTYGAAAVREAYDQLRFARAGEQARPI